MNKKILWKDFLNNEFNKDYYKKIMFFLESELNKGKIIYPKKDNWLNALSVNPEKIKVIILGQDPYHGENQAHGFSFSVEKNVSLPPSLKNIFKEISIEFNIEMSKKNGNLTPWVEQGVMLLNSVLTVEKGNPASHKNIGWEKFTDEVIEFISTNFDKKVFLLWGNYAIQKKKIIDENKHLILTSPHPSPFSAHNGFFGNNHFKLVNDYLEKNNLSIIDWQIKD